MAILAVTFAIGSMGALADAERQIRVELDLGNSYRIALGENAAKEAKILAEAALTKALGEKIKYFTFVSSAATGSHTLSFRIDHPTPDETRSSAVSLFDYYLFLDFKKNNGGITKSLQWLFRDAASSLNGVDTPETIAAKLRSDVSERQHEKIITDLLSHASFTEKARFKPDGTKGWIIEHSRQSLCMAPDSELQIESIVPPEGFEDSFLAEVKRRQSGDEASTFTRAKDNVEPLMTDPENARVLAIYVINYEAECERTVTESTPTMVTFSEGGGS